MLNQAAKKVKWISPGSHDLNFQHLILLSLDELGVLFFFSGNCSQGPPKKSKTFSENMITDIDIYLGRRFLRLSFNFLNRFLDQINQ